MSESTTLFITLHYTDKVVHTCQKGTTLFITLHYTDKVVYTYQEVLLYLSLYTTLTRLYIHVGIAAGNLCYMK